ncbi:DUF4065 domain-containing protein [Mesorhizobium sp. PAMC28654]|uniref:Panacea domain-containing protein n=1 Tax=Mesorhizobium sp. PAMC28654 TaxID=2880934 RepID=UPI001D0ADADC|nr:type II toxin-antitoxin system antitoxin SocA domain-containing protein [Mesorhizobium sp. PAMC28654]UDL90759.1 DUF4065 domain-containing protein [Mesorhizobium sp. PAMC28654]
MPAPYSPLAFANEFILLAEPYGVEHMKLQKLVYISYGWWLSVHDEPVLNEQPEVWRHGPVFPSLYRLLREHGSAAVCHPQRSIFNRQPDRIDNTDEDVLSLVRWVWGKYRHMSGFQLSDLTHKEGSPWQITVAKYQYSVPFHTEIPVDVIRDHYRGLARELVSGAVEASN